MFKYVWIIMLVIAAVIFIGYTIYAIYDSYLTTFIYATENDDVLFILSETWDNLMLEHDVLVYIWGFILFATAIATFGLSFSAYIQK